MAGARLGVTVEGAHTDVRSKRDQRDSEESIQRCATRNRVEVCEVQDRVRDHDDDENRSHQDRDDIASRALARAWVRSDERGQARHQRSTSTMRLPSTSTGRFPSSLSTAKMYWPGRWYLSPSATLAGITVSAESSEGLPGPTPPTTFWKASYQMAWTVIESGSPDQSTTAANDRDRRSCESWGRTCTRPRCEP